MVDKFETIFSSLVKLRSKIEGTLSSLDLVASNTCWKNEQSLIHSMNFVEI